jgi:hypothetical protein
VSRPIIVARLATRELWMTFRLLLVLLAFVSAGSVVGVLPAPLAETMGRLAAGLGVAIALTASVAAWTLADERLSGRTGWLVTHWVARATYLVGWYGALALIAAVGLAAGALLGWLAIPASAASVDAGEYLAAIAAVGATLAVAIAVGVLAGALLRPPAATLATVGLCAVVALVAIVQPDATTWLPGGALVLLAGAAESASVAAEALRAAGIGLAIAAAMLGACRIALELTDL